MKIIAFFRNGSDCDLNPFSTPKIEKRFSFLKKQFFFSRESGKAGLAAKMVSDGPLSKSARKKENMAKKPESTAVASKSANLPSTESENVGFFDKLSGDGLENVTAKDLIVPRLTILQGLSPQVQPKKPEYIKGASVGDICDVGMNEVFEQPLMFLPVLFVKQYLEWAPRSSGKGLVGIHNDVAILDTGTRNENNQVILPNGNYIAETAQFFGLNLSAGGRRSFLPMTSTQLKKARQWLSISTSEKVKRKDGTLFTPPLYYRTYAISTVEESNSKGDWIGFRIERGPTIEEYAGPDEFQNLAREAIEFKNSIQRGELRGDVGESDDHGSEGAM